MLRIGLSGGIGSGKSTVAARLADLGAVVIDSDRLAREVVAPGSDGLAAIVERFGDAVLDDHGALNRPALGSVVFADAQARRDLELITHPRIAARTALLMDAAPAGAIVVHDVPLLVEKRLGAAYHLVVIVAADERTRLLRLTRSRGMTEHAARERIRAQAGDEQRRAAAEVWLPNAGSRAELIGAVDRLWHERLVPFEHNVREGVPARRPERVGLAEPDTAWPAQAARLVERLARVFGDAALSLHHVGSTAVPGLVARDVIDLQVGVPSLAFADDAELVERLRRAGFPRREGHRAGLGAGGRSWAARLHVEADPGRPADLHVREAGGPGWRRALLFRDWLRADASAREEYAALKRRLAAPGPSPVTYVEARDPWFAACSPRAEDWAARTGWEPGAG
jgi:dephospho-CoA kinase